MPADVRVLRPHTEEVVEDLMDQWHHGAGGSMPLHEFLSWTEPEFVRWAMTGDLPGIKKSDR